MPPLRQARGSDDGFRRARPTSTPRVGSSRMSTFGRDAKPPADDDFLLIAAAQLPDRRFDARRLDREVADRRARRAPCRRLPLMNGSTGRDDDRAADWRGPTLNARLFVRISPSARRSSGTKPTPGLDGVGRARAARKASPFERHRALVRAVGAEQEARQFASPRADEAAKPEHLALSQIEADVLDLRRAGERPRTERRSRCRGREARAFVRFACDRPRRRRSPRPAPARVSAAPASSATDRPSRNTVTRWQSSRISSSRCET